MKRKLFFIVMLFISVMSYAQGAYYVKPSSEGGNDSSDGLSWATAFATLSKACTTSKSNSEIRISKGTFVITTHLFSEIQWKTLTIKGGYDISTDVQDYVNKTVFDGGNSTTFMYINGATTIISLDNLMIQNCKTTTRNGAIDNYLGVLTVTNSIFSNNVNTIADAGAINNNGSILTVINCAFVKNTAVRNGGAVSGATGTTTKIYNSSFSGNSAKYGGSVAARGTAIVDINNSILWGNNYLAGGKGSNLYTDAATAKFNLKYNIIENGINAIDGLGTYDMPNTPAVDANNSDPLFASATDLSVSVGSPAIDNGNNSLIPAGDTLDILGNERILNSIVDLGAYEIESFPSANIQTTNQHQLKLYPNPVQDFLVVEAGKNVQGSILILDIQGRIMLQEIINNKKNIDISNLENGVYLVRIGNEVHKFIKK